MTITLDGSTGVTAAEFDGALDASNLTGVLPAIDGSALTSLAAGNLTGTLPAIDGSALTGIDTSPPTTYNAVGTYAFCMHTTTSSNTINGSTYAGSTLYPAGLHMYSTFGVDGQNGGTETLSTYGGTTLSGTWRAMGRQGAFTGRWSMTLFVRIS